LAPGTEGGVTRYLADGSGAELSIYDASMRYQEAGIPLVVLGGKEYGSGSSRDWAAKGTTLLGVRAVIAESFERIHRSNLIGMGVIPLQFADGESADSLGLTGEETFEITGIAEPLNRGDAPPREITVKADDKEFTVRVRIDTPKEALYMRHGGILQYVLRQLNAD
jgi:aconitate hydratase